MSFAGQTVSAVLAGSQTHTHARTHAHLRSQSHESRKSTQSCASAGLPSMGQAGKCWWGLVVLVSKSQGTSYQILVTSPSLTFEDNDAFPQQWCWKELLCYRRQSKALRNTLSRKWKNFTRWEKIWFQVVWLQANRTCLYSRPRCLRSQLHGVRVVERLDERHGHDALRRYHHGIWCNDLQQGYIRKRLSTALSPTSQRQTMTIAR